MQEFNFPNWVNRLFYVGVAAVVLFGGYMANAMFFVIHPTSINRGHKPEQPIPFSHKLHAGDLKLDCRYCHNTVEVAGHAAVPPSATCGNCHGGKLTVPGKDLGAIHPKSMLLKPVRDALAGGEPVQWVRVHDVPDFVYFNHSAHVARGVSCVSCHGRVDRMETVQQVKTLSMKFCLDCHRDPAPNIRDPKKVTQLDLSFPLVEDGETFDDARQYGDHWIKKLDIKPNVSCSACHR